MNSYDKGGTFLVLVYKNCFITPLKERLSEICKQSGTDLGFLERGGGRIVKNFSKI